jgi:hypothetical protein
MRLHRAREALRQCLPNTLRDNSFMQCLKDDLTTKKWLTTLLHNIGACDGALSVHSPFAAHTCSDWLQAIPMIPESEFQKIHADR